MALIHQVYDTDAHFKIDPITRAIKNSSTGKTVLIQGDHNSERFTFELPKLIDGHDMSKCNSVQVHYINIDSTDKKLISADVHDVDDLQISPEDENVVICSWLIDGNATKYAGSLAFLLKFKCIAADGSVSYVWNTARFSQISVSSGIDNGEAIVEEYSDILEQWEARIDNAIANLPPTDELVQSVIDALPVYDGSYSDYEVYDGSYSPDYDKNVKAIAHRGFSTEAPENTIPAYILAKQKGFNFVECDVAFTADGVCVLLHDSTIDRTSNGSGNISTMTYAEAMQYDYGSWKSPDYAGTHLPTLDEFLNACKGLGLHPYIEIKDGSGITQEKANSIITAVEKAGMRGKVTYISFDPSYLRYVKNTDPSARLGYVVIAVDSAAISTATGLKTGSNEVFISCYNDNLNDTMVELCVNADLPLEVWTVNDESWVEGMNPYITGVTSDNLIAGKILYNKYMSYMPEGGGEIESWENVRTIESNDIMTGYGNALYKPYYDNNGARAGYYDFDIPIEYGYIYKFSATSSVSTAQMGLQFYNEIAKTTAQSNANIDSVQIFDPGWQKLETEVTVPEFINDSPVAGVRITFRKDTANSEVPAGMIESVTITRTPV